MARTQLPSSVNALRKLVAQQQILLEQNEIDLRAKQADLDAKQTDLDAKQSTIEANASLIQEQAALITLFPFSYILSQKVDYWSDVQSLLAVCAERGVAVQTIKAIVRAPWGDKPETRATWYEPLEEQPEIDLAVHWVLSHPQVFLNTVGDVNLVPKVFDAAERFQAAPTPEAMASQLRRKQMSHLFTQPWE